MLIKGKAPITASIEREKDEPLESKRWSCTVTDSTGTVSAKFTDMCWAEAVTYRNMFEAIQKAATIGKTEFTLVFKDIEEVAKDETDMQGTD